MFLNPFFPKQSLLQQHISSCLGAYSSSGNWAPSFASLAQEPVCLAWFVLPASWSRDFSRHFTVILIHFFPKEICSASKFLPLPRLPWLLWSSVLCPRATTKLLISVGCFVCIWMVGWYFFPCFVLLDFLKGLHFCCIAAWWITHPFSESPARLSAQVWQNMNMKCTVFYQEQVRTRELFNVPTHFCKTGRPNLS